MSELDNYLNIIRQIVLAEKSGSPEISDDYILELFNKLSDEYKLIIIKDAALFSKLNCNISDSKNEVIKEIATDRKKLDEEITDIGTANKIEMIKLKAWMVKAGIIGSFILFTSFIIFSLFLDSNSFDSKHGLLKEIQSLYNIIMESSGE